MSRFTNLGAALFQEAEPDRVALVDLGGETPPRRYSFADIERLSGAVAQALLQRGLARGERVAILSANRAEFLLVFLGAMRAGLVAVPVNHKLPAATVAVVLEDCDARLVFADAQRMALLPPGLPVVAMAEFDAFVAPGLAAGPFATVVPEPSDPAMYLYTSGSTGRPKGVVLSHHSHLWVLEVRAMGQSGSEEQRVLVAAPLYHMNGLAVSQFALSTGGLLVLLPGFTVRSYIEAAAAWGITNLTAVPPMLAMMLQEADLLAEADLGSVKMIRMGSAPVTQSLVDRVRRVFPRASIGNGYGTTEAGPIVFAPHPQGKPTPDTSVGCAHPLVDLRLVRDGRVVTDEGVLEMRCPALMNGYHKLLEATAKAITGDGYYITGDVFQCDQDGFYTFVGRADDMFVSGGENIYPGEIETILESHPAILQACVVPLPDEIKGTKPVAFAVLRPGATLTEEEARAYVLARAPAYAHPRRVWFLPALPLAGTNKVDRKALLREAMQDS
jgi:long-chain acyl-CoA synthetase